MPLYSQFLTSPVGRGEGPLKRAYWVFGEEPLLIGSAVGYLGDASKARFGIPRIGYSDRLWDQVDVLGSQGLDLGQQMVIVQDADGWTNQDTVRLQRWIDSPGSRSVLVMVSKEFPLSVPVGSGIYQIKCSLPADPEAKLTRACEIAVLWAKRMQIDVGDLTLRRLVMYCGVDLNEVHSTLWKASFFPNSTLTPGAVVSLAISGSDGRLLDSLLAVDRTRAVHALDAYKALSRSSWNEAVSNLVGGLTSNLVTLKRLHGHVRPGVNSLDLARRLDLHAHVVRTLRPFSRLYPPDEVDRRLGLLSRLDHARASGATDGVLESLVASW